MWVSTQRSRLASASPAASISSARLKTRSGRAAKVFSIRYSARLSSSEAPRQQMRARSSSTSIRRGRAAVAGGGGSEALRLRRRMLFTRAASSRGLKGLGT